MSSRPSTSETGLTGGLDVLRPDDVTSDGLPIAMRGYDRNRVDRLLSRVSQDYLHVWLQRDTLRERLRSLEAEVQAAEGEARASATSVAELVQRVATVERELAQTRAAKEELEARLARSEGEREEAVRRAGAVERPGPGPAASATPAPPQPRTDGEAARLLLSAARAAAELRDSARERAQNTLRAARERAASLAAETKRERSALAEMQERRREAERVADEVLARARAEAEHVAAAIGEERDRVRSLLSRALASLDVGVEASSASLLADLSARLRETGETDSAAPPPVSDPGP